MIDVPEQPKKEIEFFFVKRMDELLPLVLTEMPEKFGATSAVPPVVVTPPTPVVDQPAAYRLRVGEKNINSDPRDQGEDYVLP